jgi:hypothetical protein
MFAQDFSHSFAMQPQFVRDLGDGFFPGELFARELFGVNLCDVRAMFRRRFKRLERTLSFFLFRWCWRV